MAALQILTRTSDWASQLVTVRRNEATSDLDFAHVLLTFGFETAVSPTRIEIDLFHCPDWGIGAPRIAVHVNEEYNLTFNLSLPHLFVRPSQSSCDYLSTVSISGELLSAGLSYHTVHILILTLIHGPLIQWVYIGEVRFIGADDGPTSSRCLPLCSSSMHSTSEL